MSDEKMSVKQRKALSGELYALAEEVRSQNMDMSEAETDAIADKITGDAVQSLVDKGKIRFED